MDAVFHHPRTYTLRITNTGNVADTFTIGVSGESWVTEAPSSVGPLAAGAGADVVTLKNGHWALAYNDTEDGRHSLAISLSTDGGQTWPHTRHLERDMRERQATRSHYPSIIQGRDGALHVVYSYHHNDRGQAPNKTVKYARFSEDWITATEP